MTHPTHPPTRSKMTACAMYRPRSNQGACGPHRGLRLLLLALCSAAVAATAFGARHLPRRPGQGRLQAARRLRTGVAVEDLLPRPGESHRVARHRVGARRLGGAAQPVVGRPVSIGISATRRRSSTAPRQGRHQGSSHRGRSHHGAGRSLWRRASPRPTITPTGSSSIGRSSTRRTAGWCPTRSKPIR